MYQVYCDDKLLHDTHIEELKLINPKLDLEVNKTGSFTFTIYPSHPYFGMLKKLKSLIRVYQNNELIFRGRILDDAEGFKNERQVTCEGELAFLLDSSQRPYEFKGDIPDLFTRFINAHNAQVEEAKQFKVGKITVTDKNGYISRSDTQYLSTYDSIFKKLIDTHGGYLNIRHEVDGTYIDYLEDFTKQNAQDIELRKNILDLNAKTKGSEIATAIIPLGAKIKVEQPEQPEPQPPETENPEEGKPEGTAEEGTEQPTEQPTEQRLTIESVNDGKDYVYNAEAVERFGWIYRVVTWDDVTLPENLLRKAKEELATAFLYEKSIEISAVDLAGTNRNIAAFRVGTYNKVVSDIHGLNEFLLVKKLSLNLTNPKGDKLTLGKTYKSLTEQDKDNDDKFGNIIDRVETIIGDYEVNKPMIDQVLNRLTLAIERNHPLNQSYNPNTDVYVPDYTDQPLRLTPIAKYRAQEVKCKIIWKRVVDDEEFELEAGETVNPDDGVLTITKNFGTEYRTYKCYATYTLNTSNYVANAKIDFNKVNEGLNGETGVPGAPGEDGRTSYFHIKYSQNPDGNPMIEDPATYIGTYVDFEEADSTDPARYTWAKFEGMDGAQGIPGENGKDGRTTYLHIAYADSEDGTLNFDIQNSAGKLYIGQYTDFEPMDSTNPHDYKWSKIKGEDGAPGKDSAIQSPTEPEDKTLLWLDTSVNPPLLKQWNGEEWVVVNDVTEEIKSLREELRSEIQQESDGIRFEVSQNFYTKEEAEQLQSSIGTQFDQTKKDFTFTFNEFNKDLQNLGDSTNAEFQRISEYIRFENGNIEMGATDSEFKRLLTRTKDSYLQNGVEIAYFGNQKLYVTDGEFISSCMFGNFGLFPEENESLSFRKAR